jgi:hypothetical protein
VQGLILNWSPEWQCLRPLRNSVQEVSLQDLVWIQVASYPAVIGSPIGRPHSWPSDLGLAGEIVNKNLFLTDLPSLKKYIYFNCLSYPLVLQTRWLKMLVCCLMQETFLQNKMHSFSHPLLQRIRQMMLPSAYWLLSLFKPVSKYNIDVAVTITSHEGSQIPRDHLVTVIRISKFWCCWWSLVAYQTC